MELTMKKRLRKKKRLGEFREWGREVSINLREGTSGEEFINDFIGMIEDAKLCCGGGGRGVEWKMVVELGTSDRETKWNVVRQWLESRRDIADWSVGYEFDLWHGCSDSRVS
jgi:uncharacterized protein